jgi:hypothetical protein
MIALEVEGDLFTNHLIEETMDFIDKFKTNFPNLYKKTEFQYLEDDLIIYYLFKDEPEKVRESLEYYIERPVESIEQFLVVADKIAYYGYMDIATDLAEKTYVRIRESSELLAGSEYGLVHILFLDMCQKIYCQLRDGEPVDWKEFKKRAVQIGYKGDNETIQMLKRRLTDSLEDNKDFRKNFRSGKANRNEALDFLSWVFMRYMWDQKNIPFWYSNNIWTVLWEFLNKRRMKSNATPEAYFDFSIERFENHPWGVFNGEFADSRIKTMALLWGLPYIYNFLLSKQLISEKTHKRMIKRSEKLKDMAKNSSKHLWKYEFVHRYEKPDNVSEEEFQAEIKEFRKNLSPTPLSEKP